MAVQGLGLRRRLRPHMQGSEVNAKMNIEHRTFNPFMVLIA